MPVFSEPHRLRFLSSRVAGRGPHPYCEACLRRLFVEGHLRRMPPWADVYLDTWPLCLRCLGRPELRDACVSGTDVADWLGPALPLDVRMQEHFRLWDEAIRAARARFGPKVPDVIASDPRALEAEHQAQSAFIDMYLRLGPPVPPDAPPEIDRRLKAQADPHRLEKLVHALARCDDALYRRYMEVLVELKQRPERLGDRTISAGIVQAVLEDPEHPQLLGDLTPFRERLYRRFRTITKRLHRRGDPQKVAFKNAVEDAEAVVQAARGAG